MYVKYTASEYTPAPMIGMRSRKRFVKNSLAISFSSKGTLSTISNFTIKPSVLSAFLGVVNSHATNGAAACIAMNTR
jgi:hypothetical protein